MHARFITVSALLLTLASGGCGAPTRQAKVANAVLTLLTNTILGYATKDASSTSVDVPCGSGEGEGSFRYEVPSVLSDPTELIRNPDVAAALVVSFNQCVIRSCDDTLTLHGGTAELGMGVTASELVSGAVPAAFTLRVTDQTASGMLTGSLTYAYKIEAEFTAGSQSSLKTIQIKEADPAAPLTVDGTVLSADKILDLSDGC